MYSYLGTRHRPQPTSCNRFKDSFLAPQFKKNKMAGFADFFARVTTNTRNGEAIATANVGDIAPGAGLSYLSPYLEPTMNAAQKENEMIQTVASNMAVPLARMMTSGNAKVAKVEKVAKEEISAAEREQANIAIYNNFEEQLEASRKADEEFCKKIADELKAKRKL